jgi:hypothetical protein
MSLSRSENWLKATGRIRFTLVRPSHNTPRLKTMMKIPYANSLMAVALVLAVAVPGGVEIQVLAEGSLHLSFR